MNQRKEGRLLGIVMRKVQQVNVRLNLQVFLAVLTGVDVPATQHGLDLKEPVGFVTFALGPGRDEEGTGDVAAVDARDGELWRVDGRLQARPVVHLGVAVAKL